MRIGTLGAWGLVVLAGSLAGPGCATLHRPPATIESLAVDAASLRLTQGDLADTMVARLARRVEARGDLSLDLLFLSGGGANGAYGAGFLRGWCTRGADPMPEFDLVTGISTGALQASFAFAGSGAALDTLCSIYRHASERITPTLNRFFWLRRDGGVFKTGRLQRTIESVLDERACEELLVGFRRDRQIVIATTDYDLGIGRLWDYQTELGGTPAGRTRLHTLLLAASAIPGLFPPVVLDGHVHADGGVMGNLLLGLGLADYRELAGRLRARGTIEPVTIRAWVVMNYWTHAAPRVVDPASRSEMNERTNALLFTGQQPQLLSRLSELCAAVNAGVPGLRMEMRCTAIPAELALEPGASTFFDEEWMWRLELLGFERATGPAPWDPIPSSFERPAPVPHPRAR